MARRNPDDVRPPQLALPALRPADLAIWQQESEHDGLEFARLAGDRHVAGSVRVVECRLVGARFEELVLRRSRFIDTELVDVEVTTFDAAESEWSDVVVRGGRLGALLAPGATLTRVALRGLRSNYVSLRGATVVDLTLSECRIEELDLGTAAVQRAVLAHCEIDRLVLSAATLRGVDLRSASIAEIEGIAELRGATISPYQLTRLAPALAEHLGVRVVGLTELRWPSRSSSGTALGFTRVSVAAARVCAGRRPSRSGCAHPLGARLEPMTGTRADQATKQSGGEDGRQVALVEPEDGLQVLAADDVVRVIRDTELLDERLVGKRAGAEHRVVGIGLVH